MVAEVNVVGKCRERPAEMSRVMISREDRDRERGTGRRLQERGRNGHIDKTTGERMRANEPGQELTE